MEKRVALFEVKELKDADDANGSFEAILSVPVVDRDGEVVAAGAFEPLPAEIPIHKYHDFSAPVATATPYYDGDVLKARGTFDPDADSQAIRSKVGRSIRYMSVGFMAADRREIDGIPTITKAELLEASFVSVPANREAAITAVKQAMANEVTTKAGRTLSAKNEASLRQAVAMINDVLQQLGEEPGPDPDDGKAVTRPEDDAAAPAAPAAAAAASPLAELVAKSASLWAEAELALLGCD